MPKQVGDKNSKRLVRQATFGSFIKLYHTHFCTRQSWNIFVEAVLRPARVRGPLLPSVPVSYATVKTMTTEPASSEPTPIAKTMSLTGYYHKCNLPSKTALTSRFIKRRCFNGNTSYIRTAVLGLQRVIGYELVTADVSPSVRQSISPPQSRVLSQRLNTSMPMSSLRD